MGTTICGSSSRGSFQTANAPIKSEAAITSGVSLESIQAWAKRPAGPRRLPFTGEPLCGRRPPARAAAGRSLFRRRSSRRAFRSPAPDFRPRVTNTGMRASCIGHHYRLQLAMFGDGRQGHGQRHWRRPENTARPNIPECNRGSAGKSILTSIGRAVGSTSGAISDTRAASEWSSLRG